MEERRCWGGRTSTGCPAWSPASCPCGSFPCGSFSNRACSSRCRSPPRSPARRAHTRDQPEQQSGDPCSLHDATFRDGPHGDALRQSLIAWTSYAARERAAAQVLDVLLTIEHALARAKKATARCRRTAPVPSAQRAFVRRARGYVAQDLSAAIAQIAVRQLLGQVPPQWCSKQARPPAAPVCGGGHLASASQSETMRDMNATKRAPEPPDGDERSVLLGWLAFHRSALEAKCAGLDAAQLVSRSAPPTTAPSGTWTPTCPCSTTQ